MLVESFYADVTAIKTITVSRLLFLWKRRVVLGTRLKEKLWPNVLPVLCVAFMKRYKKSSGKPNYEPVKKVDNEVYKMFIS